MSPLVRNIAIAFGLAVIATVGYFVFLKEDEAIITESVPTSEAIRDSQEFLMRVRQLEQMQLNGKVLKDPRFTSLVDFTLEPEPEDVGRDNPFEPFDGSR